MVDLSVQFAGIRSPNPFWLASGPPTNTASQVRRALEAGWGGAVWKTVTDEPLRNVSSRYGGLSYNRQRLIGMNNIELISDRPLQENLEEIRAVKRDFPGHAVVVSAMTATRREAWSALARQIEQTGADGIELNFGCPHGMNERGMGSAVGQDPDIARDVCSWVREAVSIPVLAKLTPNVTDIATIARACVDGGAHGLSLINTINSIIGVDLKTLAPRPDVGGFGTHGGYCGPAVKPVALHMVSQTALATAGKVPLSGIGGIRQWEDAAEFLLLGATTVQLCTAVMHRGFGIIRGLLRGLSTWMKDHGFNAVGDLVGRTLPRLRPWGDLDLNHRVVARINQATCIHCGICYDGCEDGAYQAIEAASVTREEYVRTHGPPRRLRSADEAAFEGPEPETIRVFTVREDACVGCNLCALTCPVEGCISMHVLPSAEPPVSWNQLQARKGG
jgi:dihydropyrimidine dehydrogenase (NAD+) subunit PreA